MRQDSPGDGRIRGYYPYILASKNNRFLTVGLTDDLIQLVQLLSAAKTTETVKAADARLVYFEFYIEPKKALNREKRIGAWKREWQVWLIEDQNPHWSDLGSELLSDPCRNYVSLADHYSSDQPKS